MGRVRTGQAISSASGTAKGRILNWFHQGTTTIVPSMGGATPELVPTVGGAAGHMKLEPSAKFTGKGFPTVWDWLEETANWLELSPCTSDQWINIVGTWLEKGASS